MPLENASVVTAITSKRWIALIVIGGLLFLIAAGKGIYALKLEDPGWRAAIAVLGLALVGIGIWDGLRGDGTDQGLQRDYGFKITSPRDNADVSNEFELEGTYETKPPEEVPIRSFVFSSTSGCYWPSSRPVVYNETAKRWSVTVRLGGNIGDKKLIGLALLGKNAQLACRYYDDVSGKIVALRRQYNAETGIPGIPGKPSDWKECDRVGVRRGS
jgi:hypothetical protein